MKTPIRIVNEKTRCRLWWNSPSRIGERKDDKLFCSSGSGTTTAIKTRLLRVADAATDFAIGIIRKYRPRFGQAFRGLAGTAVGPPITGPFPDIVDHVVEPVAVGRKCTKRRVPVGAPPLSEPPGRFTRLPGTLTFRLCNFGNNSGGT